MNFETFNSDTAKMVESIFAAKWALNTSPPPICYQNVAFRQPSSGEWIRLTVVPGLENQASLGCQKVERQHGAVIFQIFTAKNIGDRRAKVIADMIAAVFRFREFVLKSDGTITTTDKGVVIVVANANILGTEDGNEIGTETGQALGIEVANYNLQKILFRSPVPREVPERATYYQLNVSVPYQADRLFT